MKSPKGEILGVGIDILEIERIRQTLERHGVRFLNRLFTEFEQDYCLKHKDPAPHLAGRFCAKEAVVKALGTGFGQEASWKDIEIINDEKGKPNVQLSKWLSQTLPYKGIFLSISHCNSHVTAVAIWTKDLDSTEG